MTWTLWRLFNSSRFPYFFRIPSRFSLPEMPEIKLDSSVIFVILIFLGLLTTNTLGHIGYVIYIIPILGTLAGVLIATSVGQRITFSTQNGSFDLLAVTLLGHSGATWVICLDTFQNHGLLRYLHNLAIGLYRVILGIWILMLGASLLLWAVLVLGDSPAYVPNSYVTIWNAIIIAGLIGLGLYIDFVQSTLAGSIAGMISPTWILEKDSSRLIAGGIFLLNQILFYTLAVLVVMVSIEFHDVVAWYFDFLIPIFTFVVIYLLRELNIFLLLHLLAHRFQISRQDILLTMQAQSQL